MCARRRQPQPMRLQPRGSRSGRTATPRGRIRDGTAAENLSLTHLCAHSARRGSVVLLGKQDLVGGQTGEEGTNGGQTCASDHHHRRPRPTPTWIDMTLSDPKLSRILIVGAGLSGMISTSPASSLSTSSSARADRLIPLCSRQDAARRWVPARRDAHLRLCPLPSSSFSSLLSSSYHSLVHLFLHFAGQRSGRQLGSRGRRQSLPWDRRAYHLSPPPPPPVPLHRFPS